MKKTISKRTLLRRMALLVTCGVTASLPGVNALAAPAAPQTTASTGAGTGASARPNILFILVDDMGFADLSIMGNRKVSTPHLDKLAQQGALLTRFYNGAPICSPSRAAFFTGRFPAEVGFVTFLNDRKSNAEFGQRDWLDPYLPNLASTLRSAGYATAHFGKWHLGGGRDIGDAPWPTAYGFDESFTTFEGLGPRVLVADEERSLADQSGRLGQGPAFYDVKSNLTQLYASKTLEFAARHHDRPWFVQLWLNDVHDPWAPDEAHYKEVRGKGANADDDRYLATLVKMDRSLGNLFDRLRDMGQFDNTLIVFTSDNGPGARQIYYKDGAVSPGSAGSLRGRKGSLYEGGIRQPLIISWPARIKGGIRDESTVAQAVDFLPTLAVAAGVNLPGASSGINIFSSFLGEPITRRPPLFWSFGMPGASRQPGGPFLKQDKSPRLAIRDGRWKLLAETDGSNAELYDLEADPSETRNLVGSEKKLRDDLLRRLLRWSRQLHPHPAPPPRFPPAS